jgi:hypothetical protein
VQSEYEVGMHQKSVDAFRLDEGGNAQSGVLDEIVLCQLNATRYPVLGNRMSWNKILSQLSLLVWKTRSEYKTEGAARTDVKLPGHCFHIGDEARVIEGERLHAGIGVDPISYVTLHELRGLVLNSHAREEVRDARLDGRIGIFIRRGRSLGRTGGGCCGGRDGGRSGRRCEGMRELTRCYGPSKLGQANGDQKTLDEHRAFSNWR